MPCIRMNKMSEFITIHVGQAGNQIGNSLWELFCLEHSIEGTGKIKESGISPHACFQQQSSGQFAPLSLHIDLDPTVIDEIRRGPLGRLFPSSNLISGKEDSANNYVRGMYTIGRDLQAVIKDQLRKLLEASRAQNVLIVMAHGGGTGAGLGNRIKQIVDHEFSKEVSEFAVIPSKDTSTGIVEPYNALFALSRTPSNHMTFLYDNQQLYSYAEHILHIEAPSYTDINRTIAQSVSALTSTMRFETTLGMLEQIATNLVPFPKLSALVPSYCPPRRSYSVAKITNQVFQPTHTLTDVNLFSGKLMSCSRLYRGYNVNEIEVGRVNSELSYGNGLMKEGRVHSHTHLSKQQRIDGELGSDCLMLSNCTSIKEAYQRIANKYDQLYAKRAFVHWFIGQGIDEGVFTQGREEVMQLISQYESI